MNQKSSRTQRDISSGRKTPTPDYIKSDLELLENYFTHHRAYCSSVLSELFSRQANVYLYSLDLMYYSKDYYRGKLNSLSQFILDFLKQWCTKQDISHLLTLDIKRLAVHRALLQFNGNFIQSVCEVFKIKEDYDYFKTQVKYVLKEKKFKEVVVNILMHVLFYKFKEKFYIAFKFFMCVFFSLLGILSYNFNKCRTGFYA